MYWLRTLCCITIPPLLALYYTLIWYFWIRSNDYEASVKYGRKGGRWVYYSWFVLSAIGLNLSKYALAGVEAGMLMDRKWKAQNAMQLMMHCDKVRYRLKESIVVIIF